MKRLAVALVAVLFLMTAALHVLSHLDLSEQSCAVCHVSQSSVPGSEAPRIAVAAVSAVVLRVDGLMPVQVGFTGPAAARAPPASRA